MNKKKYDEHFKSIFHSYYSPLCNYAFKIVGIYEVAEDIVQNLFVQVYEKNVLENISYPDRYLIKSVKFRCIDYQRNNSKYREVEIEEFLDEPSESVSDLTEDEVEPLLHYFAAKLPEKCREVFLLSRKSGMTYKEISEELNISVKTVEAHMARALRQLKEILKSQNFLSLIFFL